MNPDFGLLDTFQHVVYSLFTQFFHYKRKSMFSAVLINNPFSDPGVYVKFKYRNEAFLFDLGDLHHLPSRQVLRISSIFVSHTHMDHFIGFDYILRICLGRDAHISLFGPPGFIKNVESKINAYTWNLVENYSNDFVIEVTEMDQSRMKTRQYRCNEAFKGKTIRRSAPFTGTLLERDDCLVQTVFLDHKTPSLAFSVEEKQHINIMKNSLEEMGLPQGNWLNILKDSIMRGDPDDTPIRVPRTDALEKASGGNALPLGELKEKVVRITPGQKVTYVADAVYNEENARKIVELAETSDILFIEASFLDEEREKAAQKYHLTAKQAGELARKAGVKRIVPFHFSPKYKGQGHLLEEEALMAFEGFEDDRPPHIFSI